MRKYGVVVIGAGPAGTTAARLLAESGVSVLLLERSSLPRVKPCGGALTHRALPLLPAGYEAQLKSHPTQWTFRGRRNEPVTVFRDSPYCHIVERQYFDQFLAEAAFHAGAEIHDGEAVTGIGQARTGVVIKTRHEHYEADYVVAADGAKGMTAKSVGFHRPQHGAAIETEVAVDDALAVRYADRVEISIGRYPWGYAWVIPRGEVLNVGVGSFRPQAFPLKQRFFEFAREVLGDRPVVPLAHPLPYRLRYTAPLKANILFAGDAAGYMDAFSAEGIYSALRSGHLAAESICDAMNGFAPLERYNQRLYQEFWPSLKSAVKMGLLFYPLAGFWSDFFTKNPSLLSDYLDVAMGRIPYHVLQRNTERALLAQPRVLSMHRNEGGNTQSQ